jgi:GNAT superfamily N-acetyltransferase
MMDAAFVRWAQPGDAASIAGLIQELLEYYGQPVPAEADCLAAAGAWLSGEPGMARAALAFAGTDCCAIAVTARLWPAEGIASALMVKELFVSESFRRRGIGKLILGFLARHCAAEGIARMDLTTEDWNGEAIRFYERNGATRLAQKVYLRFDDRSIIGLAADE